MHPPESRPARLREVAAVFARLGFTAFGGPAAHIAMMEEELVVRRRWLDRQLFLDLLAAINFIPGPSSTELAIQLGLLRRGRAGLVVAGVCFILPAVLIILPLGWLYVKYAYSTPRADVAAGLVGIKACVVAIVLAALVRFARTGIKDAFTAVIAVMATLAAAVNEPGIATWLGRHHWLPAFLMRIDSDLTILAGAALAGMIWYGRPRIGPNTTPLLLPIGAAAGTLASPFGQMALFFLKIGATLLGSGYLLVRYLQAGLVDERHWLTQQQLFDAVAVGQVTPGPLLTTATFIGYLLGDAKFGGGVGGGIAGAFLATGAIFFPSFVFVGIVGPILPKLRKHPLARGALDGANAAVVALIFVVAVRLGATALRDVLTWGIAIGSVLGLLIWRINTTWLILGSAALGVAGYYVHR